MLLTDSQVAKTVRNYLLNLEEEATKDQKERAFKREVGKLRRRFMTDTIRDFIPESPNKHWRYRHFTELAYKKTFGKSTKELRLEKCVKDDEQLRDKLTSQELNMLEKTETVVAGLIMAGYSYKEIKSKINDLALSRPTGTE